MLFIKVISLSIKSMPILIFIKSLHLRYMPVIGVQLVFDQKCAGERRFVRLKVYAKDVLVPL